MKPVERPSYVSDKCFERICASINDYTSWNSSDMNGMSSQCQMLQALLVNYLDLGQYYHPDKWGVAEDGSYVEELP